MTGYIQKGRHNQAAPVLVCTLLTLAMTSHAKEYSLDYSVEGRSGYNDNTGLNAEGGSETYNTKVSLPITLTMRSDRLATSLMGEVASSKYSDSGYNSDDQNLQGHATYQSERGSATGRAGFRRDSTRNTEFLDSGVVGASATRVELATAGGNGSYMFTEKNGIIAGTNYTQANYESPRLVDYKVLSGNAGWTHQWSENLRLRLQGTAAQFENEARLQVTSNSLGAQAGLDSTLSERLSVSLLAGWSNVDTKYSTNSTIAPQDDSNNSSYRFSGSLSYQGERYKLEASGSRQNRPSSQGYVMVSDRLELAYQYDVSELTRFKLIFKGGASGALDDRINNDRVYARVRLELTYRLSPAWYVGGAYTFAYQDNDRASGDASSNAVKASVTFHPEKNIWSR